MCLAPKIKFTTLFHFTLYLLTINKIHITQFLSKGYGKIFAYYVQRFLVSQGEYDDVEKKNTLLVCTFLFTVGKKI